MVWFEQQQMENKEKSPEGIQQRQQQLLAGIFPLPKPNER